MLKYEDSINFEADVPWYYNYAYRNREEECLTHPSKSGKTFSKEDVFVQIWEKETKTKIMRMTAMTMTANIV